MGKFGLYAVDATEKLELEGYNPTGKKWKRSALVYNGAVINKTAAESNKFGVYIQGKHLKVNGSDVATSPTNDNEVTQDGDNIKFGDVLLQGNKCVNITLSDYNKLRSGYEVAGYAKYNPFTVYNIVTDINATLEDVPDIPEELEDRVLASFKNELLHNEISDKTYLDPVNTPSLAIRAFDAIINKGEGISFNYFVDTFDYASIYKNSLGDETPNTFTLVVEDSFGNVLYKHTTYAGEFKCTTAPFMNGLNSTTPLIGITWFSIRCIDNEGRGSMDRQFKVLIKDPSVEERIYEMITEDLDTFHITLDTGYDDLVAGYNNKKGLEQLFIWCKANGYTGVKLYNENTDPDKKVGDSANTLYRIDNHHRLLEYGGDDKSAFVSEGPVQSISELSCNKAYYLIKYENGVISGIDKDVSEYKLSDFAAFKIVPGGTITIEDKTWNIPNNVVPYDWIRHDGAKIYRDDNDKILVYWNHDLDDDEVPVVLPNNAAAKARVRALRIKYVNDIILHASNLTSVFREGDGYYYLTEIPGKHPNVTGDYDKYDYYKSPGSGSAYAFVSNPIEIPDDFTIDLNYATLEYTNSLDISTANKMFHFGAVTNSHLKNGKLVGAYKPERTKDGFLKSCRSYAGTWEGYSLLSFTGSEFCTVDNVEVEGSGGYETVLGALIATQSVSGARYGYKSISGKSSVKTDIHPEDIMRLSTLGYINNGVLTDEGAVVKYNGDSLLPPTRPQIASAVDYNYWDGATDVCLVTSDDFINLDLHFNFNFRGEHQDWEVLENHVHAYYVTSNTLAETKAWHGGKRMEYFISFYDENNNFIKTIKTMQNRPFYIPNGATKIKLTGYGLCNVSNDQINLVLDEATGAERALMDIELVISAYTQGCKFDNLYIHDTRSIALCGAGINVQFNDCHFERIAEAPRRLGVTPMFMDVEENCNRAFVVAFRNCSVLANMNTPAAYQNSQTVIGIALVGVEYELNKCNGLSMAATLSDCLIKDSIGGLLTLGSYRPVYYKCNNIIKRLIVSYQAYFDSDPTNKLIDSGKLRNTTDQEPTTIIVLEDSAINQTNPNNYGNMTITGRSYFKEGAVDNYIPIEEQLND